LKIHRMKMSGTSFPRMLRRFGGVIASCSLVFGAVAAEAATEAASISGDSTTVLRIRETSEDQHLYPLYEYLHLAGSAPCPNGVASFYIGGWGRGDLADSSTRQNNNGDFQYGYMKYQANKSNLQFSLGRQFITEGVASEKIDGLYARTDLAMGFTVAGFIGEPVTTEPDFKGGDIVYGGRIAHFVPNLYAFGLSALKSTENGNHLRAEEGIDFWLHPLQQIDLAGRSSYNSLTDGWMEHAYTASITPLDALRISAAIQKIDYKHYFDAGQTTTNVFSLNNGILDPKEEVLTLGGSIGYTLLKNVDLSADYKHYNYDIAGDANYYGGRIGLLKQDFGSAGFAYHRMNGSNARLKYDEYHAYLSKKLGRADVTLDFFDVDFDNGIYSNGMKNTYSVTAAAGYDFPHNVRVAADIDFSRSSDFDHEVKGLIQVTYAFGSKGGQSEK